MKYKSILLETVSKNDWSNISDQIGSLLNKRKKGKNCLDEALEELSRQEHDLLWKSSFGFCSELLLKHSDPPQAGHEAPLKEMANFTVILKLIEAYSNIMDSVKNSYLSENLVEFMIFLASAVQTLQNDIRKNVLELCTNWVQLERQGYKDILPKILIFDIEESLNKKAKKATVKQVWKLKNGLQTILLESSPEISSMLISCSSSSLYLSCEEGIKFVSLVLCIKDFTGRIHSHIKTALPNMNERESSSVGEIYFRGWKISKPGTIEKIEECIQDLMYSAVYVSPGTRLSENLFSVVTCIHRQKKHLPTAAVLYGLYEPFIWRSLNAANGQVRRNAIRVLCDAFPLTENKTKEEEENLRNKQYQIFVTFLLDQCHIVRIKTIQGTFNILSQYWRLVPSNIIQDLFQIYIGKLLVDSSSNLVRAEVVKGLTLLLDCADAVPFVTSILPKTAESFDDVDGTVRQAYIRLLLKVKTTKLMKYWTIVPMDHLLLRIGADSVTRVSIVHLIRNSFLPVTGSEKEWVQRALSMIEIDRTGARHFYQIACKQMDLEEVTKFIICIWRTLYRYVHLMNMKQDSQANVSNSLTESTTNIEEQQEPPSRQKKRAKVLPRNNKENMVPSKANTPCSTNTIDSSGKGEDTSVQLPLHNLEVTGGLVDIMVIMWTVNSGRLNHASNFKYLEALRSRISKSFSSVWSFFKETSMASNLLYLASFLPQNFMPTMVGLCMSKLKSMESLEEYSQEMNIFVVALCNWNRVDDLLELVSDSLETTFKTVEDKPKTVKKTRKVQFAQTSPPKPLLGLHFIRLLLNHRLNRLCLLEKNRHLFCELFRKMGNVMNLVEKRIEKNCVLSQSCSDDFLIACMADYLCFAILLNSPSCEEISLSKTRSKNRTLPLSDGCNAPSIFMTFIDIWERIIFNEERSEDTASPFETQCVTSFIAASADLMASGVATNEFLQDFLKFLPKTMPRYRDNPKFNETLLLAISEANTYLHFYESDHVVAQTSILQVVGCAVKNVSAIQCQDLPSETISSLSKSLQPLLESLAKTSNNLVEASIGMILYSALSMIQQEFPDVSVLEKIRNIFDLNNICVHFLHNIASIMGLSVLKVFEYNFDNAKFNKIEIVASLCILRIINVQKHVSANVLDLFKDTVEKNCRKIDDPTEESEMWIEKVQELITNIGN